MKKQNEVKCENCGAKENCILHQQDGYTDCDKWISVKDYGDPDTGICPDCTNQQPTDDWDSKIKQLKEMITNRTEQTKEPDILSLSIYDTPLLVNEGQSLPLASITVVGIKRPMRNDAKQGEEKDPIEQALGYLNRVRNGGVITASKRPIPDSPNVPGFCYVLCDITPTIKNRCDMLDLQVTVDKLGYFGYHKKFNAYIEVLSFDRLLNSAKERNRAFFDKLGLPIT